MKLLYLYHFLPLPLPLIDWRVPHCFAHSDYCHFRSWGDDRTQNGAETSPHIIAQPLGLKKGFALTTHSDVLRLKAELLFKVCTTRGNDIRVFYLQSHHMASACPHSVCAHVCICATNMQTMQVQLILQIGISQDAHVYDSNRVSRGYISHVAPE